MSDQVVAIVQITVNSQSLAKALRQINLVVPAKSTIPILSYVLLRADDQLHLLALDLEIGLQTHCEATITTPGALVAPAKKLLDLVEQFPNADVELAVDPHGMRVSSGAFTSRLQTLLVSDFPPLPKLEGNTTAFGPGVLQSMLRLTRYAIAEKSSKHVIDGALLTQSDNIMAVVATDGKRLSLTTREHLDRIPIAILPRKTIDILLTLFPDEALTYMQSDRHLFFQSEESLLTSRMLEGKFPQYERIIPRENTEQIVIPREAFAAALRRVGLVSDDYKTVLLHFTPDGLTITTKSSEIGDAVERIVVTSGHHTVCVNWSFLLDFLEAASSPSVTLALGQGTSPLLLTDGSNFLNVVMQSKI